MSVVSPVGSPRRVAGAAAPPCGPYDADILILSLDRPEETVAAIRSALRQTGLTRHVIVLDQGSADANLARFAEEVAGRDDATLLRLDTNCGVAGGRNRAASFGHGRVIAAIDNDAEFADSFTLAGAASVLDADPSLAALGMRILVHATGKDDLRSWGYPPGLLPRAAEVFDAATFVGAGHAIRRAAWDDAGPYDEALFFCWEEFDFCLRAIERGWRVQYRGDIEVRHKVSPERRVAWSGARWFYFVATGCMSAGKAGPAGFRWPRATRGTCCEGSATGCFAPLCGPGPRRSRFRAGARVCACPPKHAPICAGPMPRIGALRSRASAWRCFGNCRTQLERRPSRPYAGGAHRSRRSKPMTLGESSR